MNTRLAASSILATILVACSSVPQNDFGRIEITPYDPEEMIEDQLSKGEAAAVGAVAGAASGLFYAALLSLACGPAYAACFAGTAPAMAGATAAGAGFAAASVSQQDLDDISEFMEPAPKAGELNQVLAATVSELLEPARIADPGMGDARLSLGISSLKARKSWGKMNLYVNVKVRFDWKLDQDEPEQATKSYGCFSSERVPDDWPENSSELVRTQLEYCTRDLAQQIHDALTNRPDAEAVGFSETPY